MKLLVIVLLMVVSGSAFAQEGALDHESRHIIMVNNNYKTLKEIHVGDKVRIVLTNSTKVKGQITSIDSTFFRVDGRMVHLHEVKSISTKKIGTQLGLGGALIAGGSQASCYMTLV